VLDTDELAQRSSRSIRSGAKACRGDDPAIEDVHHYVETRLVELAGEVGYKLHTGRSRNEQIATDLRLYVREQIDETTRLLAEFASAFVKQAEAAGDSAMPAYTHLQRAEPVLVAHWLLAYVEMFLRDIDRLADCRKRVNVCPLGSGAVAGTILPLDREAIADGTWIRRADSEQHGCHQRSRLRHRVCAGAVVRRLAPQPLG
jgi:argininosuccinate lyase